MGLESKNVTLSVVFGVLLAKLWMFMPVKVVPIAVLFE